MRSGASNQQRKFMYLRTKIAFAAALWLGILPCRAAEAATQDDLKSVLDRLNAAALNFHSTSADFEFDSIQTDPIPDTDVQKGVVNYERKGGAVSMGVHMSEHNEKPSGKAYTFIGGTFKLFEPGVNQVTTFAKAGKWESYAILGFGASGKDLEAKWDIKYLGSETLNGVKTEKLELVAKDPDVRKNLSKVEIWLDPDRAVSLKQVLTFSSTSKYVAQYSNFKFNQALPGDAFTFKTNGQTVYRTQ
jgi:outer membrane lipoprotein-sorting protein